MVRLQLPCQRPRQRPRAEGVAVLLGLWILASIGCTGANGPDRSAPQANDAIRKALLADVGEHVILTTYRSFVEKSQALEAETAALANAIASGQSSAELKEASREAWRSAMAVWQEAELYQFGPAGSSTRRIMGALDLRAQVYSWPTVNSCRIDQELVNGQFENAGYFDQALVNVKGLDAIEYLLFYEGVANTCPPQVLINQQGGWDALGAAEINKRRAGYAHAAAKNLARTAARLRDAWEPSQGNFLGQLARAGEAGSTYESAQTALDALFAAMFYIDLETKDMKLARPAGISPECLKDICPEALESPWSDHAKENVVANLRGFEKMYFGGTEEEAASRSGFDDVLIALGAADLSSEIASALARAQSSAEAIPGSMRSALTEDLGSVEATHAAIKALTDIVKSRFVSVLNLRVPDEGAADND